MNEPFQIYYSNSAKTVDKNVESNLPTNFRGNMHLVDSTSFVLRIENIAEGPEAFNPSHWALDTYHKQFVVGEVGLSENKSIDAIQQHTMNWESGREKGGLDNDGYQADTTKSRIDQILETQINSTIQFQSGEITSFIFHFVPEDDGA